MERCPRCGHQQISCGCIYAIHDIVRETMEELHPAIYTGGPTPEMYVKWDATWGKRRMPWTGEYGGKAECREYGFWCVGPPWTEVPEGTPGATEDLNRLYRGEECRWSAERQKWVRLV